MEVNSVRAKAMKLCIVVGLVSGMAAQVPANPATSETTVIKLGNDLYARLDPPVVVCTSKVGESRWGHHQFASISDYPGGRILLRHHAGEDSVKAYGTPSPTYISADQGKTWQPFADSGLPPTGMSYPLLDGHYICLPMARPLDTVTAGLSMPQPVGTAYSYNDWRFYRVNECPPPVQEYMRNYESARWRPDTPGWRDAKVTFDTTNALVFSPGTTTGSLLSRTAFERPPFRLGRELIYADYRSGFIQDDGSVPRKWAVTCMVSTDNGKSWSRRSTIAVDPDGKDSLTEPMLALNAQGELVCVIRRADHEQKPMCITYSGDAGRTWEKYASLEQLGNFGVFPALIRPACGVMVMCYGRPGIHLAFSTDGSGRKWSEPYCMLAGNPEALLKHTDGYTSMLPIASDKLLIAYTDFDHVDKEGQRRKAVLVRMLTITGAN